MALSDQDIAVIEELLFSDALAEETLDYFGLHGLVCASVVGPTPISRANLAELVFGEDTVRIDQQQLQQFLDYTDDLAKQLQHELTQGLELSLPYLDEDEHYDAGLESWCIGFMEGFFYQEETWFSQDEERSAELLLPIMALSGLFDSAEFKEITDNDKLMAQLEDLVPEQLIDLYLLYHTDQSE